MNRMVNKRSTDKKLYTTERLKLTMRMVRLPLDTMNPE